MLTADLVDARKRDGELVLKPLDAKKRSEAMILADLHLQIARAGLGARRDAIDEAWDTIGHGAHSPKIAAAVRKLVDDACVFAAGSASIAPIEIRDKLFTRAAEARIAGPFDRAAIMSEIAGALGVTAEDLERSLFADLRGEHVLEQAPTSSPAAIVEAYELGRAQAILLRAARVTCVIKSASAGLLRAFFAKLKFHQLLFAAERLEGGVRVTIDGPFSMFDAGTRYGLRLALLVPALRALDAWTLEADVRWGKAREPLVFRMRSDRSPSADDPAEPHLSDDVRALLDELNALKTPFRAEPASTLLDVPGLGVCIPDLVLRRDGGEPIYVEVLGFWSRDAVFRRIELAQRGLGARVIFCVSARLRVSAELLDDSDAAALYVYKSRMSASAIVKRAERL